MSNYTLDDMVMIPTQCEKCGQKSMAPTFKQILANKESFLTKMLRDLGHVNIICHACPVDSEDDELVQ